MTRFRPEPDESPTLIPPPRLPPTAVGLATLPLGIPPGGSPQSQPARPGTRIVFAVVGTGLVVGGIALSELSLFLIPASLLAWWLGAEMLVAGVVGRRGRSLARLG
jgi:hypothetical protein